MPRLIVNEEELEKLPPEKRAEVDRLLAEYEETLKLNPLERFEPHRKQKPFMAAREPVGAFFGGNRSGKTTALIVWFLVQACPEPWVPSHLKGFRLPRKDRPFQGRLVCPDFAATMEGVILPTFRQWAPKPAMRQGSFDKAWDKQLRILRFDDESWIQCMTYEQDVDKFGGAALDAVGYDEEPPEPIRKECRMRLVDYGGVERFAMTPLHGMSWMFDDVWERRHEDHVSVTVADMDDNPYLDEDAKRQALDGLTKEELQARKEGKFVHFAGLIYDDFSDERHVVPRVPYAHVKDQDVLVVIDPGIRRTGVLYMAFDSDNVSLTFDELYVAGQNVDVIANLIFEKNREWGLKDPMYLIDPSARNRNFQTGENIQAAFARVGIYTVDANNTVEAGIWAVKRRLQHDPPLAFVAENCVNFMRERARYRVKPRDDGKFEVVKKDDHLMDDWRYGHMAREWSDELSESPQPERRMDEAWPLKWARPHRPEHPLGELV